MAAMAQQDCGQCGYNCEDYCRRDLPEEGRAAESLRAGRQGHLPHAQDALRRVRRCSGTPQPRPAPAAVPRGAARAAPPSAAGPLARQSGRRDVRLAHAPQQAGLGEGDLAHRVRSRRERARLRRRRLASASSRRNDPALVDAVIAALGAPRGLPDRRPHAARGADRRRARSARRPTCCSSSISYLTGGERRQKAKALAAGDDPDGDAKTLDVLAAIEKFPGIRPDPEAFIEALDPLQPRLYSISSSPKAHPGRVSLTVDTVRYPIAKRTRLGVASTFLAERIAPGDQGQGLCAEGAQHFGLPADPAVPIIMIGPGTGIAPFRAFLHERMATKAPGRNWLFFGHQRRDYDFFYEDEFAGMSAAGVLTRLSLAWSRDDKEKFYVQDRMREVGRDLWAWLADGAARLRLRRRQRMGKDVERALVDIVAEHGVRTHRRGDRLRHRSQEERPLSDRRVLSVGISHSSFAPEALMTAAHFGISDSISAEIVRPTPRNRRRAAANSSPSGSFERRDERRGAASRRCRRRPGRRDETMPGRGVEALEAKLIDGRNVGRDAVRVSVVTASGRTSPLPDGRRPDAAVANIICTWPPMTSCSAGTGPCRRHGRCRIRPRLLNNSPARCAAAP